MSLFQSILSELEKKISIKNTTHEKTALIVSAVLHTTITAEQIIIQDTTLRINAGPTIKMALSLNRERLIIALQEAEIPITVVL